MRRFRKELGIRPFIGQPAINWQDIDTVLLDIDGTLLDLHYDNFVWDQVVPEAYAQLKQLPYAEAKEQLFAQMQLSAQSPAICTECSYVQRVYHRCIPITPTKVGREDWGVWGRSPEHLNVSRIRIMLNEFRGCHIKLLIASASHGMS